MKVKYIGGNLDFDTFFEVGEIYEALKSHNFFEEGTLLINSEDGLIPVYKEEIKFFEVIE